jgi:hypothetical protein
MDNLLADSISAGRVVKYFYSLVVIKRRLNISFRSVNEDDIKHFIIEFEKLNIFTDKKVNVPRGSFLTQVPL